MIRHQPRFTLFPYTTLFRSIVADIQSELSIVRAMLQDARGTAGRVRHDGAIVEALMEAERGMGAIMADIRRRDRKSTRLNSSHSQISYAVFCLKKKKKKKQH